jgi:glycosyltransferase involved in cell wall biosynthesis
MADRNVLLVTYHFPPSAASGTFRMLGLARHLPKFGWRPIVVAPPSLPWEPADEDLVRDVPADVRFYPTPYPSGFLTRVARRLLGPYPVWVPAALAKCRRALREQPIEGVITSGPPHVVHLIGLLLKRRGLFWIADFRDPWVPHGNMGSDWAKVHRWSARAERAVFRRADVIVSNVPRACRSLHEAYPDYRDRIVTITNGFDPDRFAAVPPAGQGPITVVHTGELYVGRDPRTFLDALALLKEGAARPIRAAFLGRNTGGKFDLEGEVRQRGLEEFVRIGGQVSYRQSLLDMNAADILLLLDGKGRLNGTPAKLYEYLGARRPILALAEPDSDTDWVLRTSGVPHRIVRPPGEPAAIGAALGELVDELQAGRYAAPTDQVRQFTREHMAEAFARLLPKDSERM